jgi:hypothetical protein
MTAKSVVLCALLPSIITLLTCGRMPDQGGTDTGNARVTSMLYNPGGTPAVGVVVYIRPDSTLADTSLGLPATAGTDSTVTDNNGNYSFDTSLDAGTYVIEAASGNNAVLIDSVVVTAGPTPDTLPPDTLKPAGAIKGIVYLSEGGDPRKVFVLAFGIDRFTSVNADGSFRFSALARGNYNLRLISSLDDYDVLDTVGVPVLTADTTDLGTIELPYTGIPIPRNLQIQYDTMKQIVTLIWNRPVSGRTVQSYTVYRKRSDSASFVSIKAGVTDTAFSDSTGVQDQTYEYCAAVVDTQNTEGVKAQTVTAFVSTVVRIADSTSYSGYIMGIAVDGHENIYLTDRSLNKIVLMDSSLHVTKTINHIFNLPHDVVVDSNFNLYVVDKDSIYKIDSAGNILFNMPRPYGTQGFELARLGLRNNSELWVKIYHWPTATLYKYTLTGNLLDSLVYNNSTWQDGDFAFDSAGNLIVFDYNYIRVFDSTGSLIKETIYNGGFFKQTASFDQIEFSAGNKLFLVDRANLLFCAFDNSGNVELKWTAGQSDFDISSVYGWRFGPSGSLYVAEVNKIRKYRIPM